MKIGAKSRLWLNPTWNTSNGLEALLRSKTYTIHWKIKQLVALTPGQMPPPGEKSPICVNKTGQRNDLRRDSLSFTTGG